ncbi:MAG: hypothetical protein JSS66_05845 [Armatimonadetes bacterium]|nr:hypothetical protein [Armatimonadota bacterium]
MKQTAPERKLWGCFCFTQMANSYDFSVYDDGSICILKPLTQAGTDWMEQHIPDPVPWGNGTAVERRFIQDICYGILGDGLSITKDGLTMAVQDGGLVLILPTEPEPVMAAAN